MDDARFMELVDHSPIRPLLEQSGIRCNPDTVKQLMLMLHALKLYDERSQSYGAVWRNHGAKANLQRAAAKLDRLMEVFWHGRKAPAKGQTDDAYDAINYLLFFLRLEEEGNMTGEPREVLDAEG